MAIVAEWLLGVWLLSGVKANLARGGTVALFSVFTTYTLHQAARGRTSCDCFGAFALNSTTALSVDLGAVLALLLCRVGNQQIRANWRPLGLAGPVAGLFATALLGSSVAAFWWHGPPSAFSHVPGLYVRNTAIDLGVFRAGEEKTAMFELENRGGAALEIQKIQPNCSCMVADQSSRVILPNEKAQIPVTIKAPLVVLGTQQIQGAVYVQLFREGGGYDMILTVRGEATAADPALADGRLSMGRR